MVTVKSTTERGYDSRHKRLRADWQQRIDDGELVRCARCGKQIRPGDSWDLGHADDRRFYTGPECIPCNRGAGGRNGAAVTNRRPHWVSRDW